MSDELNSVLEMTKREELIAAEARLSTLKWVESLLNEFSDDKGQATLGFYTTLEETVHQALLTRNRLAGK